jgi:hypothetical protein
MCSSKNGDDSSRVFIMVLSRRTDSILKSSCNAGPRLELVESRSDNDECGDADVDRDVSKSLLT